MRPSKFYTRRNFLTLTFIIFVSYVSIALIPFYFFKYQESNQKRKVEQEYIASQSKLSPEMKSIQKAENYLISSFSTIDTPQRLFLDYLQRKFDLNKKFSVTESPIEFSSSGPNFPQPIDLLARVAYPDLIVDRLPREQMDSISYLNVYGANCGHFKLPSDFWEVVDSSIKNGGYELTHVSLMLVMMQNNKCALPEKFKHITDEVNEGMIALINEQDVSQDLRYEAIVFLMLNGKHEHIDKAWIDRLVSKQNDDGSWSDKGDYANIDHTTLLAYWALLEYLDQDKYAEPIIR